MQRLPKLTALDAIKLVVAGVAFLGVTAIASTLIVAALADLTGDHLSSAILVAFALVIAAVVPLTIPLPPADDTLSQIIDRAVLVVRWLFSVVVAAVLGLMAAFYLVIVIIQLSEHQMIGEPIGSSVLKFRELGGGVAPAVALAWVAVQFLWIVPLALQIKRQGKMALHDAYRYAATGAVCSVGISGLAILIVLALGPTPQST